MRSFNRNGQFKVTGGGGAASGGTADNALNTPWPLIRDDDDGLERYLYCYTLDGVDITYLDESNPKVQDDDDGLWRWLRSQTVDGVPVLYLDLDTPSDVPGREAVCLNYSTGLLKVVKSKTVDGVPTIYLQDV